MKLMGMIACCLALLTYSSAVRAEDPPNIKGVNKLLDRIEKAHASRDLKTLTNQCVDDALVSIVTGGRGPDRKSYVMTKKQVMTAVVKHIWGKNDLKTRSITDRGITLPRNDLAIICATATDTCKGGQIYAHRTLYFARRKAGVWRICFSMPQIFRPTLIAASVSPGSAAEKAGLKPGDEVIVLGGVKTDSITARDLIKPLLTPGPDRKKVTLTVRRGKKNIPFTIPIGVGAVRFEPRLMPRTPGKMPANGRRHPVGKLLLHELEVTKTGKAKDYDAIFHPKAFFSFRPLPDKPVQLLGLAEGKKSFVEGFQQARKVLDMDKFTMGRVDVITDGEIAMASGQFSLTFKENGRQLTAPTRTQVYVRMGDKWRLVANLVDRIRYGLAAD